MPKKQSSPELSSLAARYGQMTTERLRLEAQKHHVSFWSNFRSICMSVVSQDETKGQKPGTAAKAQEQVSGIARRFQPAEND